MKPKVDRGSDPQKGPTLPNRWVWLMIAAALIILLGLIRATRRDPKTSDADSPGATRAVATDSTGASVQAPARALPQRSRPSQPRTAEEIVAAKVVQFGRSRREIVHEIARRLNQEVPPEVEKFFDAVE